MNDVQVVPWMNDLCSCRHFAWNPSCPIHGRPPVEQMELFEEEEEE